VLSALAVLFNGFISLAWWKMPLAIGGILLAISGPSMLIAWLKLRQRNIGPILDANGWAVNARAKLNIPFGASLTAVAALPSNAERSLEDPFEEKRTPWVRYALAALVVAAGVSWYLGYARTWIAMLKAAPAAPAAPIASASSGAPAAPPAK